MTFVGSRVGDVNAVCDIFDAILPVPADPATTGSGMNIEQKNVPICIQFSRLIGSQLAEQMSPAG